MSTFDQKLAAQTGQVVSFANNAALALSRQVAERQRQLAQELRAPVIVETPAERAEKKEHPGSAERRSPKKMQTKASMAIRPTGTVSMSVYELEKPRVR